MGNTVLVIHHNANIRSLFRFALDTNGYQTVTAQSGESGLRQANHSQPNLIILQLELPDVGGREMISRIKGNLVTQNIPVVLCTDCVDAGARSDALHLGAASILNMPVTAVELLKVVRAYIPGMPVQGVAVGD